MFFSEQYIILLDQKRELFDSLRFCSNNILFRSDIDLRPFVPIDDNTQVSLLSPFAPKLQTAH